MDWARRNGSAAPLPTPSVDTLGEVEAIARWTPRHWATALLAAVAVTFAVGIPSDVIPNPVFARPTTPVTWWAYPVLLATAVLGGLLAATYVRDPNDEIDRPGRVGGAAGVLSFFAVGCPTCNKLVVVAIGSSGALDWFAPAQPVLAVLSLALLAWALRQRLRFAAACRIPAASEPGDIMAS